MRLLRALASAPAWGDALLELAVRALAGAGGSRVLHVVCDGALTWCAEGRWAMALMGLAGRTLTVQAPGAHVFGSPDAFLIVGDSAGFVERALSGLEFHADRTRVIVSWPSAQRLQDMRAVFRECWWRNVVQVVAVLQSDPVEAYTYYPFASPERCFDWSPVLLDWRRPSTRGWELQDKVSNMQGCTLRVATFNLFPYHGLIPTSGGGHALDGVLREWFHSIVRCANFTPLFSLPTVPGSFWGGKEGSNGLMGDVVLNKSDLAFAISAVRKERGETVSFETSSCLAFCVPVILIEGSVLAPVFRPLQFPVWLSLFVGCGLAVATLMVIGRLWRRPVSIPFRLALSYVLSPLIGRVLTKTPSAPTFRCMMAMLHCFGLVVAAVYQASWHGINAIPRTKLLINNVDQLMQSNLDLIVPKDILLFVDNKEPFILEILAKTTLVENDIRKSLNYVASSGTAATIVSENTCMVFDSHQEGKRRLQFFGDRCLMQMSISCLTVKRGSPFSARLSDLASRLFESGLTRKWYYAVRKPKPKAKKPPARALGLSEALPVLLILALGLTAACAVLLGEVVYEKLVTTKCVIPRWFKGVNNHNVECDKNICNLDNEKS